jgi:hypothetical protein
MSTIRTSLTGTGWTQIGTGPATVQVISPDANGVEVMVDAAAAQPTTNSDGLVLSSAYPVHHFTLAEPIWAQVVQPALTAIVAAQPEAS